MLIIRLGTKTGWRRASHSPADLTAHRMIVRAMLETCGSAGKGSDVKEGVLSR